jgi:hypothetical protein
MMLAARVLSIDVTAYMRIPYSFALLAGSFTNTIMLKLSKATGGMSYIKMSRCQDVKMSRCYGRVYNSIEHF